MQWSEISSFHVLLQIKLREKLHDGVSENYIIDSAILEISNLFVFKMARIEPKYVNSSIKIILLFLSSLISKNFQPAELLLKKINFFN